MTLPQHSQKPSTQGPALLRGLNLYRHLNQPIQPQRPHWVKIFGTVAHHVAAASAHSSPVYTFGQFTKKESLHSPTNPSATQTHSTPAFVYEELQANVPLVHERRIIGQLFNTYILIEQEDGLFVVDQHAAHERVLYASFARNFQEVATVQLLFAHIIQLNEQDLSLLSPHLHLLHAHGIYAEPLGTDQLVIQATPVYLKDASFNDLIMLLVAWIKETEIVDKNDFVTALTHNLRASMACKAAVRAGDTLTTETMQTLLNSLAAAENNFCCPHGRPTGFLLEQKELEKKFKRDYKKAGNPLFTTD